MPQIANGIRSPRFDLSMRVLFGEPGGPGSARSRRSRLQVALIVLVRCCIDWRRRRDDRIRAEQARCRADAADGRLGERAHRCGAENTRYPGAGEPRRRRQYRCRPAREEPAARGEASRAAARRSRFGRAGPSRASRSRSALMTQAHENCAGGRARPAAGTARSRSPSRRCRTRPTFSTAAVSWCSWRRR